MKRIGITLLAAALVTGVGRAEPETRQPELAYQLTEGQNLNAFVRDGQVAAHLLLRNGTDPRILVAFPAGNSGVGLWFAPLTKPATWQLEQAPRPLTLRVPNGAAGTLNGIVTVASIDARQLTLKQQLLTSIRFLRDYQSVGRYPPEVAAKPIVAGDTISLYRERLDGRPGFLMKLEVLEGRLTQATIVAGRSGRIRLRLTAATGEPPLTGLAESELLNGHAGADTGARNALRFLSYREKFLAGSWRFQTYFGRDTLMSIRLLMPALRPAAIEAGLGSVLARLNERGEVAHEEGIGEFAAVEHQHDRTGGATATLDFGMIDDDFMLAPVAADYLLGPAGTEQARAFLARPIDSESRPGTSEPAGTALVRNLRFVIGQAQPFARDPGFRRLVAIKAGRLTGQWRDSEEGLGRGRYAYDVNAVFVPAALEAGARLLRSGLLEPYMAVADRAAVAQAAWLAESWHAKAPALFRNSVPNATAATAIRSYSARLRVPAQPALAALAGRSLTFHAIALDDSGRPIPIIHSDEGFALLFGHPSAADLDVYLAAVARPFPAGLMTPVGMLVANPVLADRSVQDRFAPTAYHGTVVWSWQQALMAAGLERQIARTDLPAPTRAALVRQQAELWRAISATQATRSSELWSWAYRGGRYQVTPFGVGKQDVDESNAAQLWSTVYLAVRPPQLSAPAKRR
ncbi:hypothetical protein [Sphingomonas aerophila]|uniref:Uncharacterized protein n=1 Tax=Sphingomonas aerophila TaxID=1344948 RepID=A0A7W9BGG5_9SPHN|nr:hypothetical protein [Sphingomonas aerophila]MBB5716742.1 hypothetical protein [Sphingomonas aerophila]